MVKEAQCEDEWGRPEVYMIYEHCWAGEGVRKVAFELRGIGIGLLIEP